MELYHFCNVFCYSFIGFNVSLWASLCSEGLKHGLKEEQESRVKKKQRLREKVGCNY